MIGEAQRRSIEAAQWVVNSFKAKGKTYSLNVLIDDYNDESGEISDDYVHRELANAGLAPDHIVRESLLAGKAAEALIDSMADRFLHIAEERGELSFVGESSDLYLWAANPDESVRRSFWDYVQGRTEIPLSTKDEGTVERLVRRRALQSRSEIVLRYRIEDGTVRYTCPLLTLCWHLMRLGVEPFAEETARINSFTATPFPGDRLLTILPASYLKLEATTMELLLSCQPKRIRKRKGSLDYLFF